MLAIQCLNFKALAPLAGALLTSNFVKVEDYF